MLLFAIKHKQKISVLDYGENIAIKQYIDSLLEYLSSTSLDMVNRDLKKNISVTRIRQEVIHLALATTLRSVKNPHYRIIGISNWELDDMCKEVKRLFNKTYKENSTIRWSKVSC